MSITFYSDLPRETAFEQSPCLCAQMAPRFMRGATLQELAAYADHQCPHCNGNGIETVPVECSPSLNLCNGNAELLLRALGLQGSWCSIPEARRGVIRALNRGAFTVREPVVKPRLIVAGLDREELLKRVARFEQFVEDVASKGAAKIYWG